MHIRVSHLLVSFLQLMWHHQSPHAYYGPRDKWWGNDFAINTARRLNIASLFFSVFSRIVLCTSSVYCTERLEQKHDSLRDDYDHSATTCYKLYCKTVEIRRKHVRFPVNRRVTLSTGPFKVTQGHPLLCLWHRINSEEQKKKGNARRASQETVSKASK